MQSSKRCPKCEGSMVEGFTIDQSHNSGVAVSTWQPGPPVKSFWMGVKQSKKDQLKISTWRCGRCGFLENYALEESVRQSF